MRSIPTFLARPAGTRAPAVLLGAMFLVALAAPLAAAPGDVVSLEFERRMAPAEIDGFVAALFAGAPAPKAVYPVDVYWLKFESVYPDGVATVAQTQVFIPDYGDEAPAVRPLYAFGPGSTGVIDACRPSREHLLKVFWGRYRAHTIAHAGQGSIGLMPDYLGFGDPERDQYYMVAEAEAAVMLDAIRAAKAVVARGGFKGVAGTRNYVAGFSQGGHAAFAAADHLAEYAPGLRLDGVIGYGPSCDLVALFREFPDVAPMILYTFRNLYGEDEVDPDLALADKFAPTLDRDVTRQCVGSMQSYYPIDPRKLFKPAFAEALLAGELEEKYPGIYRALEANKTGLAGHRVPVMICQGTDDIVVYGPTQDAFVAALREAGSEVDYRVYEGARHDTRQAAFRDVQAWMNRGDDTGGNDD
ncbi:MAG: hypothetical protein H7A27_04935 [Spirochaetaceae bacterium]|nr:hypothetical protein [Spirochaetaceae bacterium]